MEKKRCGVAVTDVLKIAANSLPVVPTAQLLPFLIDYCGREPVERIIVGEPRTVRGEESDSMRYIRPFLGQLRKALPEIPVEMVDERFTSVIAHREMIAAGFKSPTADAKVSPTRCRQYLSLQPGLNRIDGSFFPWSHDKLMQYSIHVIITE